MISNYYLQSRGRIWSATLILILLSSLLVSGCGAEEPQVYRVGVLSGLEYFADNVDGFKAEMSELGYVEGENIVYDLQTTDFDMAAYQRVLKKFVADEVDLMFVFPTEAALEAKVATQETDIPVIFADAFLEGTDLVNSIREPGGNITGVRFSGPDLALRRFEILQELTPQAKRMLLPYQRGYPAIPSQLEAVRAAAEAAGITLVELPADTATEIEADLQARLKSADIGFDAVLCIAEPLTTTPDVLAALGKVSAESKAPIGGCPILPDSYSSVFQTAPDNVAVGKQAASLADKILSGTPAGTIPVISPENVLRINYKVAQELGLSVDEGLLSQAAEIIR